jgi:pyruvate/2-oxoglutarate dehydrogenase complex dihydrolipoamide dehydrogenase (E3) component
VVGEWRKGGGRAESDRDHVARTATQDVLHPDQVLLAGQSIPVPDGGQHDRAAEVAEVHRVAGARVGQHDAREVDRPVVATGHEGDRARDGAPVQRRTDLLVVGGGTAGLVAARTAARCGARVVLAEPDHPGGDCLWTGCVPSKAFLAAAAHAHAARDGGRFGVHAGELRVDFAAVMAHVHRSRERIAPVDSVASLTADGVDVRAARARFTGPGHARLDPGGPLRFRRAVVCTGAGPVLPDLPGLADVVPLTTDTVWDLTDRPGSLVVLGAGPVGCELGQGFARLGTRVTLVEAAGRVLPSEEASASARLERALVADGVDVRTGARAVAAHRAGGGVDIELADGMRVSAECVLVALGRRPDTAALGLDRVGVELTSTGHIGVDDRLRTSAPGILAAGDVVGTRPFTHVAGVHGSVAATNAVLAPWRRAELVAMPRVTYTEPEVAHVGLTEDEARAAHGEAVRIRSLEHREVDRAVVEDATEGLTRVVLDDRGRVLGATIVAPRAAELISELTALVARGGRLRDLAGVTHPYPGWGDAVWKAALAEVGDALAGPGPRRLGRLGVAGRRLSAPRGPSAGRRAPRPG